MSVDGGGLQLSTQRRPPPALAQPVDQADSYYRDQGRDKFTDIETNPVKIAKVEPVSTFSIDVDTASYSFRARLAQPECPAAEGCGARRGDDQLFPL